MSGRSIPAADLRFDLTIEQGSFRLKTTETLPLQGITALFGASGAGKTTLLRTLAGLSPAQGSIHVGDAVFQSPRDRRPLPPEARRLGYVFQQGALFRHLSVEQNLHYAFSRAKAERRTASLAEIAESTGITHLLSREIDSLSGGEAQRVAIARALLSFPRLLLMDEALASLDQRAKTRLLSLVEQVGQKIPIVYVTHNLAEVARLADRVLLIEDGGTRLLSTEELLWTHGSEDPHEIVSRLSVSAEGFDSEHHLALYKLGSVTLQVPAQKAPQGKARLVVRASDVTLFKHRPEGTSALNVLSVQVKEIRSVAPGAELVLLKLGSTQLIASVTSYARKRLDLRPGSTYFAALKATALQEHEQSEQAPDP
jgi:molybdate transport system ATP-binding protein